MEETQIRWSEHMVYRMKGKDRQLARRLLDRFPTLTIDRTIADLEMTSRLRILPVQRKSNPSH